jgi:small-conductance mechanosensitive channel
MVHIVAESWTSRHSPELTAIASVLIAIVAAFVVDRLMLRHERRSADDLSPGISTRLRILRRVTTMTILVVGVVIALTQFAAVNKAAAALLASGAIAAAVIGFAARTTLANAIAGILIAVAQPIRLGDLVTIEGETGVVEDVRLSYTFLRTADNVRIIIPNERLASSVLRNATLVSATVGVRASIWLAPGVDTGAALSALRKALPDGAPRIAETTADGVRIVVAGPNVPLAERDRHEAELYDTALHAVRAADDQPGRTTVARDERRS